jgi:hypothetical protein
MASRHNNTFAHSTPLIMRRALIANVLGTIILRKRQLIYAFSQKSHLLLQLNNIRILLGHHLIQLVDGVFLISHARLQLDQIIM